MPRPKHHRKRSRHGRVFEYDPVGAQIVSALSQTMASYPNAREILRRVVEDDNIWDLLAEAQAQEESRKDLTARIDAAAKDLRSDKPRRRRTSQQAAESNRSRGESKHEKRHKI